MEKNKSLTGNKTRFQLGIEKSSTEAATVYNEHIAKIAALPPFENNC
jgi:hypothetical protein